MVFQLTQGTLRNINDKWVITYWGVDEMYKGGPNFTKKTVKEIQLDPLDLIQNKDKLKDGNIVYFYMGVNLDGVTCGKIINYNVVLNPAQQKTLYSEIEELIIRWNIDGTKTAGSLTRDIMKLIGHVK